MHLGPGNGSPIITKPCCCVGWSNGRPYSPGHMNQLGAVIIQFHGKNRVLALFYIVDNFLGGN